MADTLDTLPAGRWAAIRAVTHSQRQRLLELGLHPRHNRPGGADQSLG